MNILIGADPEVFVTTKSGTPRSAHGLIPGSKEKPYAVMGGAVQVDGMALEFNINPANNPVMFKNNIKGVMAQMEAMLPENRKIAIRSVATFEKKHMDKQPADAKQLGCEPDWNAYTESLNPAPDGNTRMRTAAGHIHIGWGNGFDVKSEGHLQACFLLAKQMDLYLGLPSLWFEPDGRRQQLYGKPGTFRPKTYGMEYRSPSNWWLKSERTMEFAFNLARDGTRRLIRDKALKYVGNYWHGRGEVKSVLANRDKARAKDMLYYSRLMYTRNAPDIIDNYRGI